MFSALLAAIWVIPILNFNVVAKLTTSPSSDNFDVPVGKPFQVKCQGDSDSSVQVSNLKWLNPQGEEITYGISTVQKIGENSLELSFFEPKATQSGVYTCLALLDKKEMEIQVSINFFSSMPTFDPTYETTVVEENSQLKICCSATGAIPMQYVWLDKAENVIPSNGKSSMIVSTSEDGSTLIINDIKMNHSGLYTCTASNSKGLSSKVYEIIVLPSSGNDTTGTLDIRQIQALKATATSVRFGIVVSEFVNTIEVKYKESRKTEENRLNFKSGDVYEITGLIPAGLYSFQFRAHLFNITNDWSNVYNVTLLPDVPEVVFQSLEGDRVKIEWIRSIDEIMRETIDRYQLSYYSIQRQRGSYWIPGTCATTIELNCIGSTYIIAGLSRRTYYELQLRAHTSAGFGEAYKHKIFLP